MIFSSERPFVLVGGGKMGGAMLAGWLANGIDPKSIVLNDPSLSATMSHLVAQHGVRHVTAMSDDIKPGMILMAIKPQMMDAVLPSLAPFVLPDTLIASVAAGTPLSKFEDAFGAVPMARAMPNTPSMVGRGITAVYPSKAVTQEHKQTLEKLLSAVGKVVWVDTEDQIDLVTAVSGSGPAYVFWMAECLAKAGVDLGLPEPAARQLAEETVSGAGELMRQSSDDPSILRQNVTSPNGTTAAALDVLMAQDGLQPLMKKAVAAAAQRAKELAK
ncbi:MAG: pyrroline-5-carboxylate reductase [Rhodobacteraceae bacterium]|nr:pyrroline-5-carboxylate reductase [Paracoccaceae bacterium]